MASHLLSRQFNIETTRRRNLVRKVLLETLERRDLLAADLMDFNENSHVSSLTRSVLSEAELTFSSLNPNMGGYDITGMLDATLGGGGGDLTSRPWFGLIEQSYDNWSQQNGLAFSFTSGLQAEGEGGLVGEGEPGGPRLLSVAPNSTSIFTFNAVNTLNEAPTELTLRFDDFINTSNLNGIQLRAAGRDGVFGNANDSLVTPGWIGAGDNSRIIIMRFAATLADDLYRLELAGTGPNAVRSQAGLTLATRQFDSTPDDTTLDTVDFRLQLGAKVLGVVPQPVDRLPNGALSPQLNKIRVYFNDDKLDPASAQNINYYQLIFTADTVQPGDDIRHLPTSAVYDSANNMVELTFSHDIDKLPGSGAGTYRLRIGSNDVVNSAALPPNLNVVPEGADIAGDIPTANTQPANDLGTFAGTSSILRSGRVITTDPTVLQLDYPGSNFEPGHRDIQIESHLAGSADASPAITTIQYNFSDTQSYGLNALNQPLSTSITSDQRQRVREAFDFYASQLGVTFQETESSGLRIVVGDMYPIGGAQSAPGGAGAIVDPVLTQMAILDGAETWDNTYGGNFFLATMHSIGILLGYSYDSDLPVGSVMRIETATGIGTALNNQTVNAFYAEPVYPGDHDVVHGQYMYRPDNRDVDTYKFVIPAGQAGSLRIEAMAERLATSSSLDTHLTLFKMTASGPQVVATNDNSLGTDSYIALNLAPEAANVTYFLSITGKGNEDFNPLIPNTGSGAVTQGDYQLRVSFDSTVGAGLFLQDTSGTAIDGDGDSRPGGNFNFWFRAATPSTGVASTSPRTIYVDKSFTGAGNGSAAAPMNNLNMATWPAAAMPQPGDIVRVVGSTAASLTNVPAYEIGRGGVGNAVLSDGLSLQVPKGVTMMIDAGAIFKLQGSQIATGSATASVDNSNSSLQVLGIPGTPVYFTSYKDQLLGIDTDPLNTTPSGGDWGGIHFRESVDRAQGRFGWERQGIFLNYVAGANFQYGGGPLTVFGSNQVVAPITMSESRPTILNNTITMSADAALSADPNSFEETLFTTPRYQQAENFDPDYSRVGPDIRGNTIRNNSINGLFVRTSTVAGGDQSTLTTSAKFDDTEVVHVLAENLIIDSQPGGAILDARGPDVSLVQLQQQNSAPLGTLAVGANVRYKVTAIDRLGNSSPASVATSAITIAAGNNSVLLQGLPLVTGDFVGRQLWRSTDGGATYRLIAELDKSSGSHLDLGVTSAATLANPAATTNLRARPNGRLEIAPGIVVKATGSRIETSPGAQLIAEGTADKRIIFTSRSDDRYGAGGSFDTYNDGATNPAAGNWGGIISRHLSSVSIDNSLIAYAGGTTPLPGGFAGFNALEVIQSDARIANTRFESNADGSGGNLAANRVGRGPNDASVIRVVGSQPIIINNTFVNNSISNTAAISINARALNSVTVVDTGRQTGFNQRERGSVGNVGPLVKGNAMSNTGINGMRVRGEVLTSESIWDDTDIVHVLQSEVIVPDFHTYGGLTLRSRFDEGLVVKLFGPNAGFTATGKPLEVVDRIGGSLRIVGTPGFPVVLTSLADDSVGSGYDLTGRPLVDTNNNGSATSPAPGNWRSVLMLPYANDRNVAMLTELESDQLQDVGTNDTTQNPQSLGALASKLSGGDENLRLGFSVDGSIASRQDLDVYSFKATAGTQVWLDIDRTAGALDSVVELLDEAGTILAQSNNSLSESLGTSSRYVLNDITKILPSQVRGLDSNIFAPRNSRAPAIAADLYSVNPLDAGMQILLPGAVGETSTYFVRVRSSNLLPGDPATKLQDPTRVRDGITTGTYRLQVRLRQYDEVPGSTVQFADIRFATTGISAEGLPGSSPLLGQISESGNTNLGNISQSDRGSVSVAGTLTATNEVDIYTFTVNRSDTVGRDHVSVVFDIDYADGMARPDTSLWVYDGNRLIFRGTNSNIADDQASPVSVNNDVTDLTRGSAGTRDAYIGPVELIAGRTYTVRVTNNSQVHPGATSSPTVRFEPLDSVRRISIDRFNATGFETTNSPLHVAFSNNAANNRIEWNLSDVTTYIISNVGNDSRLSFANAYTGARIADVSQFPRVNDAALSPDGRLVGFEVQVGPATTDANGGNLLLINSTGALNSATIPTGAATVAGASGIQTFTAQITAAGAPPTFAIQQRDHDGLIGGNTPQGDAIVFNALGFHTSGAALALFGVGSRGNGQTQFNIGQFDANNALIGVGPLSTVTTNLVYRLDPVTGAAINANGLPDRVLTAPLTGAGTNRIEFGRFITTGIIQGLAEINGTLYAVSSLGQFFRVSVGTNPTNAFGNVNPLLTINDPETGTAVVFNGLTRGPRNLDNPLGGTFSNLLFGTTSDGTIYAFNTNGVLQPVFPGFSYKTRVAAGSTLGTVSGIDFSSLDVNLWHVSNFQANAAGHGRTPTPTGSQTGTSDGQNSLYFGYRPGDASLKGAWTNNVYTNAVANETYNFAGGAHGAIVSNPIDLTNYGPDDQPMMYFNYNLGTEGQDEDRQQGERMRDAFRVYGAGDDGNWVLLATNNTPSDNGLNRGNPIGGPATNGNFDELDNIVNGNFTSLGAPVQSQLLVDNTGDWRQARVPLAALAGKANVRLRFEFSTGATFYSGDPLRGGIEINAVAGNQIVDGTGFRLTPNQLTIAGFAATNFEFEHGLVLAMPSAASITNLGSTVTINGTVFTFTTGPAGAGQIQYVPTDSGAVIAQKVSAAILAQVPGATVTTDPLRANVIAIAGLPVGTYDVGGGLSAADIILGRPGVTPGAVSIPVNLEMPAFHLTNPNVRDAMRMSFAQTFSNPLSLTLPGGFTINQAMQAWPFHFNTVKVYKFDVTNNTSSLSLTTLTNPRAGDTFGVNKGNNFAHNDERAINNNFSGVLVDDIIIGFAERGEMVLNDINPTTAFIANPEYHQTLYGITQVETGNYQLTIRTAADYGTTGGGGQSLSLAPFPPLGRDFDTNDRLSESVTISVPVNAVGNIRDGATFTLSDTKHVLTFEFDVTAGATDPARGVAAGHVAVPITNLSTSAQIASAIRNAINSSTVQNILNIKAGIRGQGGGPNAGSIIEIHGSVASDLNGRLTMPADTFLIATRSGLETSFGEDHGDVERERAQGQVLLVGNTIRNSFGFGINASAAVQLQPGTSVARPYPGAPINFQSVNTQSWAPGVVIMNNILANNASGGVLVSDDPAAGTTNPIARIVNNTLFGGAAGVRIENNASPTILNNVFAGHSVAGVHFPAATTTTAVLGANLYQGTAVNPGSISAGSFAIQLSGSDPLFTSTTNNKFYLAAGSRAIDASANVSLERNELSLVKNPLGLPPSPILAPEIDVNGQGRRDDPSVNSPDGMGAEVFKDRGAVERADFAGPVAVILRPQDNDSQNNDKDRNVTYIRSVEANLNFFSILLQDFTGTGPDPATVVAAAVVLTENGRVLREGSDYVLGYNANSRTLRFTPLAGIWRNDSVYEITLNNRDGHRVTVPAGSQLRDGDRIAVTVGATTTNFEFDNNGSATGTAIPFSVTSTAYELAALISYRLNLAGITSRLEGGGNLFITGANNVVATTVLAPVTIAVSAVRAIQDLAGNQLAANRPTSLTQFTIVMPEVKLDFGDASGARVPTIEQPNSSVAPVVTNGDGARHALLPIDVPLLALGAFADADEDGVPSASASSDDTDSLIALETLGTLGGATLSFAGSATLAVNRAAIVDGQTFTITDMAAHPLFGVVFEFTTDASVTPGNTAIPVVGGDSSATVANKLATIINGVVLSGRLDDLIAVVDPSSPANVRLNANAAYQINIPVATAAALARLANGDATIVLPNAISPAMDGNQFSILDGNGNLVRFELNHVPAASVPVPVPVGIVEVALDLSTATPTTLAASIAAAINNQIATRKLVMPPVTPNANSIPLVLDDEDGVVFKGMFNARSNPVVATVTSTGAGMLDAWIDWNGDGDFNDGGEQIIVSQPVQAGANTFNVTTPLSATIGFVNARFRLSILGGALPSGVSIGGEVEDYLIEIVAGTPPVAVSDSYSVNEDTLLNANDPRGLLTPGNANDNGVLANDTDADNNPLALPVPYIEPRFVFDENPNTASIDPLVNVSNGTLTLNRDGTFTYLPNLDFNGTDTFVYNVVDQRLKSKVPATVTITVVPRNDAPLGVNDSISVIEDEVVVRAGSVFTANDYAHFGMQPGANFSANASNESGQVLTLVDGGASIISEMTTSFGGISGLGVRLAAKPGQGTYGIRVNVLASDLGAGAPTVSVVNSTITVNLNSNAASVSTVNDFIAAINGNAAAAALVSVTVTLGAGTTQIGNAATAYSPLVVPPSGGTVSVASNQLIYTPPAHYNNNIGGPALLLLTIQDDGSAGDIANLTSTSTLTINIAAVNDRPQYDPWTDPREVATVEVRNDNVNALVTVPNFITGILPGPVEAVDEATGPSLVAAENQSVTFSPAPPLVRALNPELFVVQPTIAVVGTTGTLTFQLAQDVNRVTPFPAILVEVIAQDSGAVGGANNDLNTSIARTFTIVPTEVNDAPEFTIPVSVSSLEDVGVVTVNSFITDIRKGPVTALDEVTQTLSVTIVADPTAFTATGYPTIDLATGQLRYETAPHVNRFTGQNFNVFVTVSDDGGTALGGVDRTTKSFLIDVTELNDAPEYVMPSVTSAFAEDPNALPNAPTVLPGFVTSINPGPAAAVDEGPLRENQIVSFVVTALNPSLFDPAFLPTISNTGTLTYRLRPDVNQITPFPSILVEVIAVDTGLNDAGNAVPRNINNAAPRTFTILPDPINDAPEFTLASPPVSREDAGVVTLADFVTGAAPGPATALDELASQTLTITVVALDPSAFTATGQPQIVLNGSNGVLTYETNRDVNSLTGHDLRVRVTLKDSGGTANVGDVDTTIKTFTLTVAAINDAPSFSLPAVPSVTVDEDHESVTGVTPTVLPLAFNIVAGPATALDETTIPATRQTLAFETISVTNTGLFVVQPRLLPNGNLTFVTRKDQNGQSVVVVRLRDSGADSTTGNGDVNVSAEQTFTINIRAINDAPEFTIQATANSREDQGLVQVPNFLTGILPGPATATDEAGQAVTVTVVAVDPTKFTVQPSIGADGRLVFQTAADVNSLNANLDVRVTLTDDGPSEAPNVNSVETIFTIQAEPINDAPLFTITNQNIVVDEDVGAYQEIMIDGMAVGPVTASDEVNQTLQFAIVSVSAPEMFSQQPSIARVGNTNQGQLSFATAQHKNGSALVVVRLVDNGSGVAPNVNASRLQTITITINPINDAPEFTIPGSYTVDEDQGLVSVNAFATNVRRGPVGAEDENAQELEFIVSAVDPSVFSVQPRIAVDGTLVFQVAENVNTDNATIDGKSLQVRVALQDNGPATPPHRNRSDDKIFTVLVNPVNDSPQSIDFLTSTDEDQSISLLSTNVLVNAVGGPTSDELNQSVFMEQVERVSLRGGTIVPVFDANDRIVSLTYTPPSNAAGADSFLYVLRDNGNPNRSGTATISVTINALNDPPQFTVGANQSSVEDAGGVTINNWATNILAGPIDAVDEHATQTVTFEVTVDNPALFLIQPTVASDGTLFYQSAADANGSTVIRVVAVDNGSSVLPKNVNKSAAQSATITILPLNDAPVFTSGGNISIVEDSGLFQSNWATNIRPAAGLLAQPPRALDEQQQIVDFTVVVDKPNLFSVQPTVSSTGVLSFTPSQNAFGNAVLTIRAVDRGPSGGQHVNTSDPVTITVTIIGENDPPVAVNDSYTTDENSVLTIAAPGLLSNDFDVDGSADIVTVIPATIKSSLGADVTINADGSFTYDPSGVLAIQRMTTNQFMSDTFTYTAIDSSNEPSNLAVVTIRVNGINDAPIAQNDQFSIGVGQTRLLEILANDTDIDSVIDGRTIQITQVPIFGTVIVNQTGVVQYTAEAGFRGNDTFAYVVSDVLGAVSNEAIVTVIVNNAPVANPDVTFTFKNEAIDIPVLLNDTDQDGTLDRDSIEIVVLPSPSGTATPQADGTVRFVPSTNFAGEVTFSYVVRDDVGTTSNVARVTVRVLNSKWQNPAFNLDVNNDGSISPSDALVIINYLNDPSKDRFLPTSGVVPPPFLDVDGNERVSSNDALLVINYLNDRSAGGGAEGEAAGGFNYAMLVTPQQMLDTVGAAVVREVERLLAQLRQEALAEATGAVAAPATARTAGSTQLGDDSDVLAALSAAENQTKKRKANNNVDDFFAELEPKLA